ncbi:heterogeneous nuclear ribonucleoprotein 1-like [Dorcoceras hygrometricum]|uniref:Heterogeneous nuclear ribonucleoprotein 1-like n=1 Tax=Dorcoceras hygrometricum TaxID=472368 RepID=A0A2Z7BFR8_9LAMI|nr:heterogeneous nuclear ribonucleoprotein 1-like [Dorcoceras hygrometricum]
MHASKQMAADEESAFESMKILIRDLAPNTTQDDLTEYFTKFGDVKEAIIPHNSVTGSPHSFGFVVLRNPLRIPFLLQISHCIRRRCVEVSRALKGEDLQTLESQRLTSTVDSVQRPENFDQRRIFVQGSPRRGITNDEFLKFFQGFGSVMDSYFWDDIGFGHITFMIKRDADRVLYRHSYVLDDGSRVKVNRLQRIPRDHINRVGRAISIQQDAACVDHVNGTQDMLPQAATSDGNSRNMQIILPTATSATDHVDGVKDIQPEAAASVSGTTSLQIVPAAATSGIDDVDAVKDNMQPQTAGQPRAAESISNTRDLQIVAAAASSYPRNTQTIPPASNFVPRNRQISPSAASFYRRNIQIIPAAAVSDPRNTQRILQPTAANFDPRHMLITPEAASSLTGYPWNNSVHNHEWRNHPSAARIYIPGSGNFPPSDQSIWHYYPDEMNYMVHGAVELHSPGPRPTFYQTYNGTCTHTNADDFPHVYFPRNDAHYGNFPTAPTDMSTVQYFYHYDDINNGYYMQ